MFSNVTLKTLIWQLAECRWSVYSPFSVCLKVSTWILKGTPFSPPCLRGVNSVLIQCTWKETRTKQKGPSEAFQAWTLLYVTYIIWTVSCKKYSKAIKGHWLDEFFISCILISEYVQICPTPLKLQRLFNQCVIASAAISEWTLCLL